MQQQVVVFGAGLVGKAIAIDLCKKYPVMAVDVNAAALAELAEYNGIKTRQADLSADGAVEQVISAADLVVGALPGFMGLVAAERVAAAGKDLVDISFFLGDTTRLEQLAEENGVAAVVDCGVAPGMGNIILGYHNARMNVTSYRCLVGGLPVRREWPWEYKAVFSPIDVIEEYTRPARYVENGAMVVREALSDPELVEFAEIGTLEAWNSDGLRSLTETMDIPNMIEKTLRYPGTIEYLHVLRESGFFSYDDVEVNGLKIRPIDLTARLLFSQWKMQPGDEDFTVMKIEIAGTEAGKQRKYTYDLFDRFDRATGTTSMARTTGYTCTAVTDLILQGKYTPKGLIQPERVGEDATVFNAILAYLAEREIEYKITVQEP